MLVETAVTLIVVRHICLPSFGLKDDISHTRELLVRFAPPSALLCSSSGWTGHPKHCAALHEHIEHRSVEQEYIRIHVGQLIFPQFPALVFLTEAWGVGM